MRDFTGDNNVAPTLCDFWRQTTQIDFVAIALARQPTRFDKAGNLSIL